MNYNNCLDLIEKSAAMIFFSIAFALIIRILSTMYHSYANNTPGFKAYHLPVCLIIYFLCWALQIITSIPYFTYFIVSWTPNGANYDDGVKIFWTSIWTQCGMTTIPIAVLCLTMDRIMCISFPAQYNKRQNLTIFLTVTAISVVLIGNLWDVFRELPVKSNTGCRVYVCVFKNTNMEVYTYTKMIGGLLNCATGLYFFFKLWNVNKHNLVDQNSNQMSSSNKKASGVMVGQYIGPYNIFCASIDAFVASLIYSKTLRIVEAADLLKMKFAKNENRQISLSTEIIADILRYFSRKKLAKKFCFVNRNLWKIATTRRLVPNMLLLDGININTKNELVQYSFDDAQEYVKDFNPETKCGYGNVIRFLFYNAYQFPVSYFLKKMPVPEFVRFRNVHIRHCEDEALIELLCNVNESFIGCDLTIDYGNDSINNDTQKRLTYLLANAFIKPAKISMDLNCESVLNQQIMQTEGILNCNTLEFCLPNYTQEFHCALLNWLLIDRKPAALHKRKHLLLGKYPSEMVLHMVEHLKQIFQDNDSPSSELLITFVGYRSGAPDLEGTTDVPFLEILDQQRKAGDAKANWLADNFYAQHWALFLFKKGYFWLQHISLAYFLLKMEDENRKKISLAPEIIADALRHLSRRKLAQHIYLVNRNFWQIATSRRLVPNMLLINELYINTMDRDGVHYSYDDLEEHVKDFNPKTKCGYGNLIRVSHGRTHQLPVSYFVKKMPLPEFVRFRQVRLICCEDQALIEFLRIVNQSFIGCNLRIEYADRSTGDEEWNKLSYLLANAFIKPERILLELNCDSVLSNLHQIVKTTGISNCNILKFRLSNYTQEFNAALLNWVHNDRHEERKPGQGEGKQLLLRHYPEELILQMIEHLKQAFEDNNFPSAFVIAFAGSDAPDLEGLQDFSLDKVSTGEKLSFYKSIRRDALFIIFGILLIPNLLKMEGRNRQITLSTETIADVLRHLSREKLARHIYPVNRNFWQIATSRHLVPNMLEFNRLYINTKDELVHYSYDDAQEYLKDFNIKTKCGYGNLIRICRWTNSCRIPVSYFVKMPVPEFVCFRHVRLICCEDQSLIEHLRNVNESFVGCDLTIEYGDRSIGNEMQQRLTYLLANAFIKPAKISIYLNCDSGLHEQIMQAVGISNCSNLKFRLTNYTQEFHCALLNWLQTDRDEKSKLAAQCESKHLWLEHYPSGMILQMIEHLKQAFEDDNSPSAFLITFAGSSSESSRHIHHAPHLEGQHDLSLDKVSTGERISFFKSVVNDNFVYRLWRRKVTNESIDWITEYHYKRSIIV
ncbi:hypothetical protein Ddc_13127 [Ditylenchus destructor]|nr:hypothetical protein Ddc_13127 [Ditylenchus destructor]